MAALTLPTFDQVLTLPAVAAATVQPEWIDVNGHMNIRHYLDLGSDTSVVGCEDCGVDQDYRDLRQMGLFTTEHHLTYISEMHLDGELTGHLRIVDVGPKAVHMVAMLLDRTNGRLANVFETMLVHVSMETRRAVDMPEDILAAFQARVEADREIDWPAPLCGAMGIRR